MLDTLQVFSHTTWQDIDLTVGSVLLDISVVATILDFKKKLPIVLPLLFTGVVYSQAVAYGSWHAVFATTSTAIGATLWGVVLVQTLLSRHSHPA